MSKQEQFEKAHADWIGDELKHHKEQFAFKDGWNAHSRAVDEELEQLREDAERYRWIRNNHEWCRSINNDIEDDDHTYLKCRFPLNTNLGCAAMLDHAINKEIKGK